MSFYGRSFLYNSMASDMYGLFIRDIDAQAINKTMGSTEMEIYEEKTYRRATPYFYGSTPAKKLSFPMSAYSDEELTAEQFQTVQAWLFSSRTYKKLQIVQFDMQGVYFNAILNSPEIVRVGNQIFGFTCLVNCDSPFAYKFPKTTTYTYTDPSVVASEIFYNGSDDKGAYLYPSLVITMNTFGGDISIENESDSSRTFSFTSLSAGEVITIDNSLQTMVSSTGLKRLSSFNKNYLRLVPGINRLNISGNVASIAMTTQFVAKKIGG